MYWDSIKAASENLLLNSKLINIYIVILFNRTKFNYYLAFMILIKLKQPFF
jgi:hypothetical protein